MFIIGQVYLVLNNHLKIFCSSTSHPSCSSMSSFVPTAICELETVDHNDPLKKNQLLSLIVNSYGVGGVCYQMELATTSLACLLI